MSATAYAALFTLAAGVASALQIAINGRLGLRIGTIEAATFQSIVALVCFVIATLALRGGLGGVGQAVKQPPWMLLGGIGGFVIVAAITYAPGRISNVAVTAILISSQLVMATLIDTFGLFGFERVAVSGQRIAGLLLLAAGAALVLKR